MTRGSIALPMAVLFAALFACKNQGKSDAAEATPDEGPASAASAADTKADAPPTEVAPGEVPEFKGCDLAADEQAFQGAWYGTIDTPVAWNLVGRKITWYDGSAERTGDFQVTSPCSFTAPGVQSAIFGRVKGQLVLQADAVGRPCGERVVACTASGTHVLAGSSCSLLTSTAAGQPGVRSWNRAVSNCALRGDELTITDPDATHRAKKLDAVYMTNGWAADKVDSFATAKEVVDLRNEAARAPKTGAGRFQIVAKWETLCEAKRVGLACNAAAWERCVDLKQCQQAVNSARLAAELRPNDGIGALDTYAVVLCQTGKKDEADSYFQKSCQAGYAANCERKCTPEVKASIDSSTVKKVETVKPTTSSAIRPGSGKRPARPARPKR
jgi:hypothetical protein